MSDAASEPTAPEQNTEAAAEDRGDPADKGDQGDRGDQSGQDEVKRRFRDALERKKNGGEAHGNGGRGGSKVRGVHGNAAHQKSFRRKSG